MLRIPVGNKTKKMLQMGKWVTKCRRDWVKGPHHSESNQCCRKTLLLVLVLYRCRRRRVGGWGDGNARRKRTDHYTHLPVHRTIVSKALLTTCTTTKVFGEQACIWLDAPVLMRDVQACPSKPIISRMLPEQSKVQQALRCGS